VRWWWPSNCVHEHLVQLIFILLFSTQTNLAPRFHSSLPPQHLDGICAEALCAIRIFQAERCSILVRKGARLGDHAAIVYAVAVVHCAHAASPFARHGLCGGGRDERTLALCPKHPLTTNIYWPIALHVDVPSSSPGDAGCSLLHLL
jgi:hypothetical protein